MALIACVALGLLCYHWVERPLLRFLQDVTKKRSTLERFARDSTAEH